MNKLITIQANQTLFDISIQEFGSIEAIFYILDVNPNLTIDSELVNGETILVPQREPLNKKVVDYYDSLKIKSTSGSYSFSTENTNLPKVTHIDSDGTQITLDALVPMVCTPVSSLPDSLYNPTKTGRPSFITGDDGQSQAGRLIDFYNLDFTSPFGNTTRFTNDLGGSFNDNSDGSTLDYVVDNATKLGYQIQSFNGTISDAIANANVLTIGSYSNFRVSNFNEFIPIMEPSGGWKVVISVFGDLSLMAVNSFYSPTLIYSCLSNGLPYVTGLESIRKFLNVRNHIY